MTTEFDLMPDGLANAKPWPRKGWWTASTGLGNQKTVAFPPAEGAIVEVGGGIDALGPPMPYTISLSRQRDEYPVGDPPTNCDFRAIVEVGAGATTRQIVTDWVNGTQIALAGAGTVRIAAQSYRPNPDQVYVGRGETVLGTSIGMTGAPHPQPRFTQRMPDLETGSSVLVTPPQWAESVNIGLQVDSESFVDPYVGGAAGVNARWVGPNGAAFLIVGANNFPGSFLPIPNGARLNVFNASGGNRQVTLMWRLSL